MRKPASHHDAANKRLFAHRRMAADLIRLLGDDWIDDLALDRLERLPSEHVGDGLRFRREDLPWWAPFKKGAAYPPGARVVFHLEFQSRVDPHMPERLLEYAVMLRRGLLRSGALRSGALAPNDAVPASVSVVVHNGRTPWTPARTVEARTAWAPQALAAWQPRFAHRLVDVCRFAGDHAPDGNLGRAALALDAAPANGLAAALGRVLELLGAADDASLSQSFELWCRGVLTPRFGDGLPPLASLMEEPTMLAETLLEWEERKISEGMRRGRKEGMRRGRKEGMQHGRKEGLERGREEGMQRGREEERQLLRSLVARRFDSATAEAIRPLLGSLHDAARLAEVGALIVECETGDELLEGARGIAGPNNHRA